MPEIAIVGEQMGVRRDGDDIREIVRIPRECRPDGPAENSIIEVRHLSHDRVQARYVSWIGYGDLDEAHAAEPGKWQLIEPASRYELTAEWTPFATPTQAVGDGGG